MRHPLCLLVVYHQKDEIEISGDEWGKKARLLYTLKGLNIRRLKIFKKIIISVEATASVARLRTGPMSTHVPLVLTKLNKSS